MLDIFILDLLCLFVASYVVVKVGKEDALTVTGWYVPFIALSYVAHYSGGIDKMGIWWYVLCIAYFTIPCLIVKSVSIKFIYIGLSIFLSLLCAEVWLNNIYYEKNMPFNYFFFDYHTLILTISYLLQVGVSNYGSSIGNYCSILFTARSN